MKFSNWSKVCLPVIITILSSCGTEAGHRGLKPKRDATGNTTAADASQTAAQAKAPKLMIARVSKNEMDKNSAKVEFVAVDENFNIANGQDAERAFKTGKPINTDSNGAMSLASESDVRFDLGMNPQNPMQVPNNPCVPQTNPCVQPLPNNPCGPQINPCVQPLPSNPCGQINPCQRPRRNFCDCNFFGGILSFIAGVGQTAINGVGMILTNLNPLAWIGNISVGYGYTNQFNCGNYNYSVYQQIPGKVPNNPIQSIPGKGEPMPQYPGYQTPGYQYPGYQTPGYQYPGYPAQVPQGTAGQEPMPRNLSAN